MINSQTGIGFYQHGDSPLHRAKPGLKLFTLVAVCLLMFVFDYLALYTAMGALVVLLVKVSRLSPACLLALFQPALWLLAALFVLEYYFVGLQQAVLVIIRFAILIATAALVVLTTRTSEMLDALEVGLQPLSRLGVDTGKVSIALSLAIRFIPLICTVVAEVREAQRTRGLERSMVAIIVPTIIRTLKMADDIADPIDARVLTASVIQNPMTSTTIEALTGGVTTPLLDHAKRRSDHIALHFESSTIDYKALTVETHRISVWLQKRLAKTGAKRSPTVALCLPNSPMFVLCFIGAVRAGFEVQVYDSDWPLAMINALNAQLAPDLLISTHDLDTPYVDFDQVADALCADDANRLTEPLATLSPEIPFYTGFTSGSSSLPKGFRRNHRLVAHEFYLRSTRVRATQR